MPITAVLPVKRFDRAKQRLKGALGSGSRVTLARAMLSDVLSALQRTDSLASVVIVSGEPHVRDLVSGDHVVLIDDPSEKGQSHAAATGIARAAALGFERALLVPADCPLLDPAEMDRLVADAHDRGDDVVIVPDRHERGTNALLIDPSGPFTPQFGEESLSRHVEQARRRGLRHSVVPSPSLGLDLDTADDLDQLMAVLARSHGRAPRTEGVLRQLERSRQRPQVAA